MATILGDILFILIVILILVVAAGIIAPLETLSWWAGWDRHVQGPTEMPTVPIDPDPTHGEVPRYYIVYLSGIGTSDPNYLTDKETQFLDALDARLPGAILVRDIFPYSSTNTPLTENRPLAGFYRVWSRVVRRLPLMPLLAVITVRNLFQVATSADGRYGPLYNFGTARQIALSLVRHGYQLGDPAPVVLMGLSGGGQIAVGAAPILRNLIKAPVWVVSIGGVLTSDPGILAAQHVWHLSGSKDHIQYVGRTIYPGCWRLFPNSAWNQAVRGGKITFIRMGPMKHMGHGDYMSRSAKLPDGESFVHRTVEVIAESVESIPSPRPKVAA